MANAATTTAKKVAAKATNRSALVDPSLKSDVEDQLETLRSDIAELTKAVTVLTKDTSNRVQAKAGNLADEGKRRLDDAAEDARSRATAAGDDAYAAGRKAAADLQGSIVQNPFAALAIAAGIGFLAGTFSKR